MENQVKKLCWKMMVSQRNTMSINKRIRFNTNIIFLIQQMSDDQGDFQKVEAGSSDCTPTAAGSVKKGGYCMLKGFPCKVTQYSTAKPGKHGSAKATIVGLDIFTNKKYEDTAPTSATMQVPNVTKKEYAIADISEGDYFVSRIMDDGTIDETLKLPVEDEEVFNELMKVWQNKAADDGVYFTTINACGQEKFISARTKKE